ncbi:MAG: ankyrin repeat domain-containing protein, partial [Chlamydiae bacterium]|nr:ankyrin repeat domain-containing protein [Chlamydiota bacterium]
MTHIPHNIANHLPDPKTPWKISPQLFNQLLPSDQSPLFKQVVVCPSDPEYNFIFQYFCAHPPEGYGISKVYCIHNPSLLTAFEAELQIMEQETSKFPSQWEIEPQADERRVAFQIWKTASQHFPSTQLLTAKETFTSTAVLPLWHGSSPAKSSSICSTGFTYFGKHHFFYKQAQKGKISSTDQGYFGSGIYFTSSAKYASRYADGNLLLAWTSMRPPYPVISDVRPGGDPYRKCSDMEMLEGKGAYQTYNAHYVPVASIFPNDPSCMIYHPCYPGQLPDCDELVVFNRSQALPCFWVQISIATPAHSLPDYSPILVDADPKGLQQWIKEDRKRLYETNSSKETLWQTAIREGQLAVLQWLHIQDPSMLHKYDEEGSTLMHLACALGQLPIARWMMERNADLLKVVNKEQWTPLHLAAFNENLSILDSFFHHLPKDLLLQVASRPCCKVLSYLLDRRVALPVTPFKQTLLHVAAQTAQEDNVIVLLKYGLDLEERDLQGRTPLFLAAVQGHRGIIQRLLSQGARLDASSNEQETVLHLASFYGYAQILDDFLKDPLGLKLIHVQDSDGKTPLHRAVWGVSKPTIVKMLLDHGADPNVLNKYDYTPLHWAAKHGHLESARILLERGANLSSANTNQDTPMDLALRWGQDDLVRLFIDPSRAVQQEVAPSSIQDPEGYHYDQFEKAYEASDPFGQIFHLEKMADLFLLKSNYMQAAHILNAAYAIAKKSQYSMSYQQLIQSKLERIEALFLQDFLQIKTLFNHREYIAKHQKVLETIRLKTQELMAQGTSIQEIQGTLTEGCKNLLIALITESIELLGEQPPSYAVFSLGSMARQEMCPYSDVEFGFFIEKNTPENKKYFRKLTKLIELKITNLGETKFPLIRPKRIEGIMSEGSSLTPSGFSMDIGGLSPLGKTGVFELIGTPDELAQFQTEEWLGKHDAEIILVNAMTRPGFLMGDQRLLDKYETHLHKILDGKIEKLKFFQKFKSDDRQRIREKRALDLLIGYVTEFEPRLDLDKIELRGFDVKRELYRLPHTVINALALYYNIPQ